VTHYPKVTKKKTNIAKGSKHQSNKQIALTSANDTYLWCPSVALASNFSGWLSPLSQSLLVQVAHASVSTSSILSGLCCCLGVHV